MLYVISDGSDDRYLAAAVRSARSLRRLMPDLPITLASNGGGDPVFTEHIAAPRARSPFRAKVEALLRLPYLRTLFLDVDTYIINDLAPGFSLLERFDIAAAQTPVVTTIDIPEVAEIPRSFCEFNTGVLFVKRSEASEAFIRSWLAEYERLVHRTEWDQPSFRSIAYRGDARLATLPPGFNLRFGLFGMVDAACVLHGWGPGDLYPQLQNVFLQPDVRVFTGERIFSGHGTLRLDFRHRRRLRTVRAIVLRRL